MGIVFDHGGISLSKNKGMQLGTINFAFRPLLDPFRDLSDFRKFSALGSVFEQTENMTRYYKWGVAHFQNFSNNNKILEFPSHFITLFIIIYVTFKIL